MITNSYPTEYCSYTEPACNAKDDGRIFYKWSWMVSDVYIDQLNHAAVSRESPIGIFIFCKACRWKQYALNWWLLWAYLICTCFIFIGICKISKYIHVCMYFHAFYLPSEDRCSNTKRICLLGSSLVLPLNVTTPFDCYALDTAGKT